MNFVIRARQALCCVLVIARLRQSGCSAVLRRVFPMKRVRRSRCRTLKLTGCGPQPSVVAPASTRSPVERVVREREWRAAECLFQCVVSEIADRSDDVACLKPTKRLARPDELRYPCAPGALLCTGDRAASSIRVLRCLTSGLSYETCPPLSMPNKK